MADLTVRGVACAAETAGTYTENLTEIRLRASQRLREILANPKPTYMLNGQQMSWTAYQRFLSELIKQCNELIAAGDVTGVPFELHSQGFT